MSRGFGVFASEDNQKFWRHWTGGFVHELGVACSSRSTAETRVVE